MSHWRKQLFRASLALGVGMIAACRPARADEQEPLSPPFQNVASTLLAQDEPAPPAQTEQPESSSNLPPLPSETNFPSFSTYLASARQAGVLSPAPAGSPSDTMSPNQQAMPALDLVSSLQQSDSVQTVNNQLRNPVSLDPRVRGYRYAQIYTQGDGAYWLPVRQDLDTPLSMYDPAVVQQIEVVPGPYSLKYGPGFSYLNVVTAPTPRYQCGYESHANLNTSYYGNGDLLTATQRVYGGSSDWGFSILHATRDGNAYRDGNGDHIPAAYNNENLFAQFGFDLDTDARIEFRYVRQDQKNTQYPGQFFQTDSAVTQGFNVQYVDQNLSNPWNKMVVESWYNIGGLHGSTNPNENFFNVVGRVNAALVDEGVGPNFTASTNASTITTGARAATVYGDDDCTQLTIGSDVRYINQYVNEDLAYTGTAPFSTGLPRASIVDPGAFSELSIPVKSYWTTTLGSRVDWVHSNLTGGVPQGFPDQLGTELVQNNVLYSFFLTNKVELDPNWNAKFGFGQAQRPLSLTERYADGEFISMIQNGFSRVIGNPTQAPERLWQIDVGVNCNYDYFRGRLNGFCSFINNFSTFAVDQIQDPTGAQLLFTTSTQLATLAGFETYVERDLNPYWTAFGSALYVDGRDQTIHAPLTQIYPLEGRAGLRLHDPDGGNRWGIEALVRMVGKQNRLGTLRNGLDTTDTVVLESPTSGFTITNLRGYYNVSKRFSITGGINNLFNKNYLEHLSMRFAASNNFPAAAVFSPGFTPYLGINWTY